MSGPIQKNYVQFKGIMDEDYAIGRDEKKHLRFRFQVRAQIAIDCFHQLAKKKTSDVKVLDLGTADGKTLLQMYELLGHKGNFVGIELSDSLIQHVPPLPPNVQIIKGDVMKLPSQLEDNEFELCTCLALLEHLTEPQKAVDEAFRVLAPGGVFVATSPNPFWDHVAGFLGLVKDEQAMTSLAQQTGFINIFSHPFMCSVTGILPYLGISLNPKLSLEIDQFIRRLKLLNFSFVNRVLMAQKPLDN